MQIFTLMVYLVKFTRLTLAGAKTQKIKVQKVQPQILTGVQQKNTF